MLAKYAALYYERRRAKGITQIEAAEMARKPLYFAALMVAAGDADGSVGGAANSTAETVRAALHCIGPHPRARLVSGVFIMALQDRSQGHNGLMAFADCAVVIAPTSIELADIAIATAETTRVLLHTEPVVALLSFSTKGSAKHPQVDTVVEALQMLRAREPDLKVDGELQADAAVSLLVGQSKAPGSQVAGAPTRSYFRTWPRATSGTSCWSGWAARRLSDRSCKGWRSPPTTFHEAAQRKTFQRGGGDGFAVGDGLMPCCRSGWCTTNSTTYASETTFSPRKNTGGCTTG